MDIVLQKGAENMSKVIYLLNMRVSGVKCIKEEVRLDFYKKTVDKKFDPEKYRIKAIYGENGSGKSALITAVKIFRHLIMDTNYLTESQTQSFLEEILNKTTQVFQFGFEFLLDMETEYVVYRYFIQLGKNKNGLYEIQYETLESKNGNYANNNYKTIFECKNGELIYALCSEVTKERLEKTTVNLLFTHSFIYLFLSSIDKIAPSGEKFTDKDFLFDVLVGASAPLCVKTYIAEEDQHELYFLQKNLKENSLDHEILQAALSAYGNSGDFFAGVSEKFIQKKHYNKYKEKVGRLTRFIKIFKPDLISIDIDAKEDGDQYVCDLNLNYGDYLINKEFESTGIKKLIRLFDCLMFVSTGGIAFVDEMDSNLNDVYLCKLIEYFMYYGKGQLCFTTHNIDPMSVLKENKNSIDFLSSDNHLIPWASRGNATPENCYKNGMIEDLPFNVEASDFVGIFGE